MLLGRDWASVEVAKRGGGRGRGEEQMQENVGQCLVIYIYV